MRVLRGGLQQSKEPDLLLSLTLASYLLENGNSTEAEAANCAFEQKVQYILAPQAR